MRLFDNVILFKIEEWLTRGVEYLETEQASSIPDVEDKHPDALKEVYDFYKLNATILENLFKDGQVNQEELTRQCVNLITHFKRIFPEAFDYIRKKTLFYNGALGRLEITKAFLFYTSMMRSEDEVQKLASLVNLEIVLAKYGINIQ